MDPDQLSPAYAEELTALVTHAVPRLSAMGDDATAKRRAPGKWSPREIIGHLVDSASNNHQRFVRAMFQDDLIFAGYAQDDWVTAQHYQDAPWTDLVTLWASFNRHLARVMCSVPETVRTKAHTRHNLDRLAFAPVPAGSPATLDYFMNDYVQHLRHHLGQIPDVLEDDIAAR
jgi:DinB superfamily